MILNHGHNKAYKWYFLFAKTNTYLYSASQIFTSFELAVGIKSKWLIPPSQNNTLSTTTNKINSLETINCKKIIKKYNKMQKPMTETRRIDHKVKYYIVITGPPKFHQKNLKQQKKNSINCLTSALYGLAWYLNK